MAERVYQGMVKIADDVVSVIAGIAAADTEGMAGMSGGIVEGFARRVSGKNVHKGVHVEVGELEAVIHLRIIVYYGEKIDELCNKLQQNVKEAVESMTGLNVVEVNIKVEGVEFRNVKEPIPTELEYRLR
jgi:uncharacterized alkaline shock family protein YloU